MGAEERVEEAKDDVVPGEEEEEEEMEEERGDAETLECIVVVEDKLEDKLEKEEVEGKEEKVDEEVEEGPRSDHGSMRVKGLKSTMRIKIGEGKN